MLKKALLVFVHTGFMLNLLLLVIAISAAYINPYHFWLPAFLKLFFTGFLAIHLVFFLFYILRKKWRFALTAAIFTLLSMPSLLKLAGMHFGADHSHIPDKKGLRIMSYNVEGFGWYSRKIVSQQILATIKKGDADIICMQEYLMTANDNFHIMDSLLHAYGYKYYREHVVQNMHTKVWFYYGLAIYSKIPLGKSYPIPFSNSKTNGAFAVDVPLANNDTFRLIDVHFESFGLAHDEYTLPSDEASLNNSKLKTLKISLAKMRKAFRRKAVQLDVVEKFMATSPYKIILCGDFNDTPLSYNYTRLTSGLEDTYLATNYGPGVTFAGNIPFLRIDYILADKRIKPIQTFIYKHKASDHYPTMCDFELGK